MIKIIELKYYKFCFRPRICYSSRTPLVERRWVSVSELIVLSSVLLNYWKLLTCFCFYIGNPARCFIFNDGLNIGSLATLKLFFATSSLHDTISGVVVKCRLLTFVRL
jgi:hypothetical protein